MLTSSSESSDRSPRRHRRTVLACVIGFMGLTLVGCGGSDSLTGTSTGTGTDEMVVTDTIGTDATPTDTTDTDPTGTGDEVWTSTVSTDTTALAGPPGTFTDAASRIEAAETVTLDDANFVGNDADIFCMVADTPDLTACETFESRHPAPAGMCTHPNMPKDVGRIEMDGSGVTPVCNSDTIRMPGEQRIASGTAVRSPDGSRRCIALPEGVVCIDMRARRGFFLGNVEYAILS